ncbi:di-trans,poly-cis-decaprenylcistransferase [candidate division WWE3 bacterium]|uniref:Isoprenyl transferase n=1 Tax=candidate division WWE3 bacterium TaxID=2053526 RepID=A0A7X9DLH9_UNCKA|nr:di-trans,poly-cis-decaprenylcistransferase [candidate division WWE3 bacterium]
MTPEEQLQKPIKLPTHVAIIPDGNRRWATQHGLPTLEGHRQGALNFEKLLDAAKDIGIKAVSGWFFSTENWRRTEDENKYLFDLARQLTKQYKQKVLKENIRFIHLGRKDRIPEDIVKELVDLEEKTKHINDFIVGVAMDYGGHDELIRTMEKLKAGNLLPTVENIEKNLDTQNMPMPDLIIRTGGELRLSGFMSWQAEYAELYFSKLYFPDFGPEQLKEAVADFSNRDRRFGGNSKGKN